MHAVIKSGARIGAVGENKFEIKKNVEYKVRIKTERLIDERRLSSFKLAVYHQNNNDINKKVITINKKIFFQTEKTDQQILRENAGVNR